ncbi:hypothetical protein BKA61DRAFT_28091 [Leptodontidium sp. MPI-SDFR-AT-0119]|nr:hypothetical protein BKA61DRAFT_28091 [Leptodontidium sp. MPI-SDFR-AT-0119]
MAETHPPYLKLPNELWDLIFSYGFARKDFLVFSTINRVFNKAVEPSLYSSFTWIPDLSVWFPVASSLDNRDIRSYTRSRRRNRTGPPEGYFSQQKPYLFLRSILESPRRAGYVKEVRLLAPSSDVGIFWDSYQARECGLSIAQFETCKRTIEFLPSELHSYWLDGLYKGKLDVIMGILLLSLTGLTSIEIRLRDASTIGSTVFDALISPMASRPHHYRYPHMKSVKVSIDHMYGHPSRNVYELHREDFFSAYLQVPSFLEFKQLESLSVTYCSPGNFWRGKLSSALNLRKLALRNGLINERILTTFLESTPHLEDLDCELVYDNGAQQYLNCNNLKSALSLVQNTLKRLVLDIRVIYSPEWNPIPWDILNSMGSLKGFEKLRYLDIPMILYATEINNASAAASLVPFAVREVDYWGLVLPDALECFGIRPNGPDYHHRYEAERCVEVYFRMNPGVKRIFPGLDSGDDDDDLFGWVGV